MNQMNFFKEIDTTERSEENQKEDKLYVLFNGEYGWHTYEDMRMTKAQMENLKPAQEAAYKGYTGKVFGDFVVDKIEYDWGDHKQKWHVTCVNCGEKTIKEDGYQWSRGKGCSRVCHCRKDKRIAEAEERRLQAQRKREEAAQEINREVGKVYGTYKVIECFGLGDRKCKVKCMECGAERRAGILKLRGGEYPRCLCGSGTMNDYKDPKFQGMRFGHLTTVEYQGQYYLCRCDCGKERYCQPYHLFVLRRYVNCGSSDCQYISDNKARAIKSKKQGEAYESIVSALIVSAGYKVKHIGKTGDYGIDIIATDTRRGIKIGVQCKCNKGKNTGVGVKAIQEAYAGGRFYDLSHFAVISYSGFSKAAAIMAKKLGVYLSDGKEFVYPDDMEEYVNSLIPTYNATKNVKAQKLYEMKGVRKTLVNWAFEYNTNVENVRKGLNMGLCLENALKYKPNKRKKYTLNGETGTITELAKKYPPNVTLACVDYRIKRGMSIEEAFFSPAKSDGQGKCKDKSLTYGNILAIISQNKKGEERNEREESREIHYGQERNQHESDGGVTGFEHAESMRQAWDGEE